MRPLLRMAAVRGVPILVHWSVPALCFFLLGAGLPRIDITAAALAAYLAMLVFHELGHHYMAVRRGYRVDRILVYPLHATCHFEQPEYAADAAAIAWGGPLAQLILAAPCTAFILAEGFTRFQSLNAFLAILGYFNPLIAIINLLPFAPLDGKAAWNREVLHLIRSVNRERPREKTALEVLEEARRKAIENARQ